MLLAQSEFPLSNWQLHLVQLVASAITFGVAFWLYRAFLPRGGGWRLFCCSSAGAG
jgi:hypothetical protein